MSSDFILTPLLPVEGQAVSFLWSKAGDFAGSVWFVPLRHGADQGTQRRGQHVRVVGHPGQDAARRPPARVRPHHPGGRERVGQVDRPGGERQGGDDDAPREGPARAERAEIGRASCRERV